ncbi:MAG TPA: hypothetical protein VIL48_04455 [Acidimicrobiales bacterium]
MTGLCLVVDVLDSDEAAARADDHLRAAAEVVGGEGTGDGGGGVAGDGGDLLLARVLEGVGGSPDVAVVALRHQEAAARLAAASPLPAAGRVVCGMDAAVAAAPGADPATEAPGGYVELVLVRSEPPIPFDDPVVVGVSRDYYARYLPMLGARHLRCAVLWHDRVRAAGGFIAFRAADDAEAAWWAEGDPWRRVAPGHLLRLPPGLVAAARPTAGRRAAAR